ncbi:MAG: hypothetical protein COV36_07020 [Alphaproteobacteria bacterium CG11_big_fil_rev_8_21_14_0_20_44_7]|nr:MAG: hypothetical protein COV36_07020 [Alphaproteobacteria bacterium CG11_big_fil_rev_8_21_14_0_20_44_7]
MDAAIKGNLENLFKGSGFALSSRANIEALIAGVHEQLPKMADTHAVQDERAAQMLSAKSQEPSVA